MIIIQQIYAMMWWPITATMPLLGTAIITIIAAVASLRIASRPISEKINLGKSAKIWTVLVVVSLVVLFVMNEIHWLIPGLPSWNMWALFVYVMMLMWFAVGAVLGLVVVLVAMLISANLRKHKRKILQCLTIGYCVILVLIAIFVVIVGFSWSFWQF